MTLFLYYVKIQLDCIIHQHMFSHVWKIEMLQTDICHMSDKREIVFSQMNNISVHLITWFLHFQSNMFLCRSFPVCLKLKPKSINISNVPFYPVFYLCFRLKNLLFLHFIILRFIQLTSRWCCKAYALLQLFKRI